MVGNDDDDDDDEDDDDVNNGWQQEVLHDIQIMMVLIGGQSRKGSPST